MSSTGRKLELGPRVVIAGTHSGVGKTTVATGVMAALHGLGFRVAAAKVGPDFIDPGYHRVAVRRPSRNLDAWLSGSAAIPGLAARAAEGSDVLVVEGMMGLHDSSGEPEEVGSTAHIAALLDAPVILVVDAWALAESAAAVLHGFRTFDPSVRLAGVIFNRVGGPGHTDILREAAARVGVEVLGALPRDDAFAWRERHLGLVPVVEHPEAVAAQVRLLGEALRRDVDLSRIMTIARAAPDVVTAAPACATPQGQAVVAVASGPAFSFGYPENVEQLAAAGAEIVTFDPLVDAHLPAADAFYIGGGFPEEFAAGLSENQPIIEAMRSAIVNGAVIWAECGGLMWLSQSIDGRPVVGAVPATTNSRGALALGYRRVCFDIGGPIAAPGDRARAHEFHTSRTDPVGRATTIDARFGSGHTGFSTPSLFASYLHFHLGAQPRMAERFIRAAITRQ